MALPEEETLHSKHLEKVKYQSAHNLHSTLDNFTKSSKIMVSNIMYDVYSVFVFFHNT